MKTYNEIDEMVLTSQETDSMDLETARQLLHEMVEKEYILP